MAIYGAANTMPWSAQSRPPRPDSARPDPERPVGLDSHPNQLAAARRSGQRPPRLFRFAGLGQPTTPEALSRRRQVVGRLINVHQVCAGRWSEAASIAWRRVALLQADRHTDHADGVELTAICDSARLAEAAALWHTRQSNALQTEMHHIYPERHT